jgi:alanine dehydrogenase
MVIGVPKEIKPDEYRVAMTPSGVEVLTQHGHTVLIERGAGDGTGIPDCEYEAAGAQVVDDPAQVWRDAEMIVKVKEPLPEEYPYIRPKQVVFTFFHFAASESLTRAMVQSGAVCLAYETIQTPDGAHPILLPMSEIAGRMAVQVGAWCLERPMGGRGVLLAGAPGVLPGTVVVIGAGVVGANAARIAAGFGARVLILRHQCRPPAHTGRDPARQCGHALFEPCEPARGDAPSRPHRRRGLCHGRAHANPNQARDAPYAQNGRGAGRCIR